MALAGDDHVLVAAEADAGGLASFEGGQGRDRSHRIGLGFFPAKAAPHAQTGHHHPVVGQVQHIRHRVLGGRGVLGGGIHLKVALSIRNCPRRLGLQVEMVLPVHVHFPFQHMVCAFEGSQSVASGTEVRRAVEALRFNCFGNRQNRRQRLVLNLDLLSTKPGGGFRFAHHPDDGLAPVADFIRRQQRFVVADSSRYRSCRGCLRALTPLRLPQSLKLPKYPP